MQIDKVISFIRSQKNGFFLIEVRTDSQLEAIENTLKDIFFEKQYEIDTSFFSIKPEDASKSISIEQIRKLKKEFLHTNVLDLHKIIYLSEINLLNNNSINALLKIIEEPSINIHFFLINNNKKILDTLLSRCINFNIFLNHKENLEIANNLLGKKLDDIVNYELINYYFTPGKIYKIVKFAQLNDFDLKKLDLKNFVQLIIKNNHYKKDLLMKDLVFDFIELYLSKINFSLSYKINDKYNYFIKRLSDYQKFNLDEESFFIEFQEEILNG